MVEYIWKEDYRMDIASIITSNDPELEKLQQLYQVVSPDENYQVEEDWSILIQIIQLEKRLMNGNVITEQSLKLLQLKIRGTNDSQDFFLNYIKIKFQDLYSDWQLLVNDEKLDKIIELMNKKVLLIKNNNFDFINQQLYYKIYYLLVISPPDFRKSHIVTFLDNCATIDFSQYSLFKLIKRNQLISRELYLEFLSNQLTGLYATLFPKFDEPLLLKNLVENNLICLTRYYQSIHFDKIYQLLQISQNVDLPALITSMIIANKFPQNCKIDGLNNVVIFNDDPSARKTLNDHILQIGNLLADIVNNMKP